MNIVELFHRLVFSVTIYICSFDIPRIRYMLSAHRLSLGRRSHRTDHSICRVAATTLRSLPSPVAHMVSRFFFLVSLGDRVCRRRWHRIQFELELISIGFFLGLVHVVVVDFLVQIVNSHKCCGRFEAAATCYTLASHTQTH